MVAKNKKDPMRWRFVGGGTGMAEARQTAEDLLKAINLEEAVSREDAKNAKENQKLARIKPSPGG